MKTVTVTVTDDDGGQVSKQFTVTVAPTIAVPALSGNEGATLSLAAAVAGIGSLADYTATVNWGDGTSDTNPALSLVGNVLTIAANHQYADNGAYPITVSLYLDGNLVIAAGNTAAIANASPTSSQPANAAAVVGVDQSFDFGTFADAGFTFAAAGTTESFTATVDWGDGSNEPLTPSWTSAGLSAGTLGSRNHAYATHGVKTVTVTVFDDDGGQVSKQFAVTVAPTISVPAINIAEGTATTNWSATVNGIPADLTGYTTTVNWGDGTSDTNPTLSVTNNVLNISKQHRYADDGSYPITVSLYLNGNLVVAGSSTATVANANPTSSQPTNASATALVGQSYDLGTFGDAGFTFAPGGTAETFTYTVAWGDGQVESNLAPASVSQGTPGIPGTATTGVLGSRNHAYATHGVKTVTVTVFDDDGGQVSKQFAVTVAPTISVPAIDIAEGTATTNWSATVNGIPADLTGYTATVNWGDGTSDSDATLSVAGNVLTIAKQHRYADNASYPIAVSLFLNGNLVISGGRRPRRSPTPIRPLRRPPTNRPTSTSPRPSRSARSRTSASPSRPPGPPKPSPTTSTGASRPRPTTSKSAWRRSP